MAFPNIYRLYDQVVEHPDKGSLIIGRIFDYDIEIELKEGRKSFSEKYLEDGAEKYILQKNKENYISLLNDLKKIESDLNNHPDSSKIKGQSKILSNFAGEFVRWFRKNDIDLLRIDEPKRLTKEQEFIELFKKLYHNPNTTEVEVRSTLYNKDYFINPSLYMGIVREKLGLRTAKIKEHPAFRFLDPKGTTIS